MKRIVFLTFSLFTLLFFAQINVLACVCPDDPDIRTVEQKVTWSWKFAQVVFVGTVVEIDRSSLRYRLRVERSWKDLLPNHRPSEILLVGLSADCEFPFKVGEKYLVYARESRNILTTSDCSGNKEIKKATEDLKVLGNGRKPEKK